MKDWLIRKLGGIPLPGPSSAIAIYRDGFVQTETHVIGGKTELIEHLGGVPLPKAEEGKYVRRPAACRMPVRKSKLVLANIVTTTTTSTADPEDIETEKPLNLCNDCGATPAEHDQAIRQFDNHQNTIECDRWRPE